VLFLHREVKKGKKNEDVEERVNLDTIPVDMIIAKQRNGPVGLVKLSFHTKYARFYPLAQEHNNT